jgi:hypothetical protein
LWQLPHLAPWPSFARGTLLMVSQWGQIT